MAGGDEAETRIRERLRQVSRHARESDIARELEELGRAPAARSRHPDPRVTFLANVLDNHGEIRGAENRSAAVACIGETIGHRHGRRKLVAGKDARLAALPWREAGVLPRFGLIENGDSVSVSYARRAVAETGSIILESGRDSPVSNSLLPEDHIVLVDAADVIERLEDAWPPRDRPGAEDACRPRCLQIISGPSSTADIALNMVYGAHGPRSWLVILIAPDAPALARIAAGMAVVKVPPAARS